MSITQPGTIPQEELLPNAGRSRSGRSTGTRCARKIGNTSVSRRVGRAHWRASSARAISRGSPLARTVKSAPMSGRWSASLLSTDTSTWALLSLRLTWMQSRTQSGVVSIQQSPWRLGGAMRTCSWGGFSTLGRPMPSTKSRGSIASWSTWTRGPLVPGHVHT